MNSKQKFELDWSRWENRLQKKDFAALINDLKIGILLKGMNDSSMKHQLLMESEKCETYEKFSQQFESIVRASSQPSDGMVAEMQALRNQVAALKGKGGGKGTKGAGKNSPCENCGKLGHDKRNCYSKGGGAYRSSSAPPAVRKGAGKGKGKYDKVMKCFECGMTNHLAKDCRAPEEKRRKYKESQKGRAQALEDEHLDMGHLCRLRDDPSSTELYEDRGQRQASGSEGVSHP